MNKTQILAGKRFLFVFCSLELGGAERQGLYLARYLKRLGCDILVWSNHANPGLVIDYCNNANIPWAIHRFQWPCRKSSLVRDSLRMIWALRKERPDVILPYTTWPNVGCGLTWRWSPAKVCIWGQRNINDLQGDAVERFAFRRISAVICNAEHEIDYLRQTLGETTAPIFVVHNGVKLDPCVKTRNAWRAELEIDEDATVATMVANFRPQKDHQTLLYAWRKVLAAIPKGQILPRLLLAGAPMQSYDAVHQLAGNLGILDSVIFLGQVKDISGLLEASDIGILTSTREGLPNAVIEYMASGLTVVATDLPGNREVLGDDPQQPFCKPCDTDSLSTQLQILLRDRDLRHKLGTRNRQRALAEFSINAMCEKTVGLIGDLLYNRTLGVPKVWFRAQKKQTHNIDVTSSSQEMDNFSPKHILTHTQTKHNVKVAIVTGTLSMGGAELMILNLGRSLRQLGYDVTIVTTSRPGNWYEQIEKNGLRALHIDGRFQVHPYRHAWRVGQRLRAENFDVVLLTKYTNSERFSQAALNMLPDNVIVIPWIHSNTESAYCSVLVNKAAWNVAVGVGARVAETAAKMNRGKKVLHIPNGLMPPPVGLLQSARSADTRPFRLCYLGRLQQEPKGIFILPAIIEICGQKKFDVVLDLVGDGPDREELLHRFKQTGLMDLIEFHGAVSHDEVFKFLCRSHVVLMPSYYEAMPSVPIEAQFCGCVPIVSKLPGVTDTIIDNGKTGVFVDVNDIDGFVEAIGELIYDPTRWQTMSDAGQRRAAEFTIDAMGQRFDQLIQACLRGEYPLHRPRLAWLPVNPMAFTWQEAIPRGIHRLGIGNCIRTLLGKS